MLPSWVVCDHTVFGSCARYLSLSSRRTGLVHVTKVASLTRLKDLRGTFHSNVAIGGAVTIEKQRTLPILFSFCAHREAQLAAGTDFGFLEIAALERIAYRLSNPTWQFFLVMPFSRPFNAFVSSKFLFKNIFLKEFFGVVLEISPALNRDEACTIANR